MGKGGTHSAVPSHCRSSTAHGNRSRRHRSGEFSADNSGCNFSASKPSSRCCSCRTDVESSNSGSVPRIPAEVPWQNRSPAGPERKFFRLLLQLHRKTAAKLHAAHALCPERESLRYPPVQFQFCNLRLMEDIFLFPLAAAERFNQFSD